MKNSNRIDYLSIDQDTRDFVAKPQKLSSIGLLQYLDGRQLRNSCNSWHGISLFWSNWTLTNLGPSTSGYCLEKVSVSVRAAPSSTTNSSVEHLFISLGPPDKLLQATSCIRFNTSSSAVTLSQKIQRHILSQMIKETLGNCYLLKLGRLEEWLAGRYNLIVLLSTSGKWLLFIMGILRHT